MRLLAGGATQCVNSSPVDQKFLLLLLFWLGLQEKLGTVYTSVSQQLRNDSESYVEYKEPHISFVRDPVDVGRSGM